MALGQVQINNQNLGQGGVKEIERHLLFIGSSTQKDIHGKLLQVDSTTNLDELLGEDNLAQNVIAAQLNGGQNWTAAIYCLGETDTWQTAIDAANLTDSFEGVVLVNPTTEKAEFTAMQEAAVEFVNKLGRWVWFLAAVDGIDATTETWADYETRMVELVDLVAAPMVVPVPVLHCTNVGALAGRLCNRSVTIADTPMRVATGSVLYLGETPRDVDGKELALSTLSTLAKARFSVPQTYPDYEGIYWGDATTLEASGGDYQFLEYIRPVHKVNRRVRIKAIRRIGDKQLNSTPESIEAHKQYFSADLREMSKAITIGSTVFAGEVMPPQGDDVSIQWASKTAVVIGLIITPHNCPKSITVNIALDLSNQGE